MREKRGRWILVLVVMLLLMGLLVYQLYQLTIVQGDEFREMADNKRIKEIEITAPRGNIYDRNGVLLAGTRPSFTVQGYKDDLFALDTQERNQTLSPLIRFVERDGADYLDAFPISLNEFVYQPWERYFTAETTPRSYVEESIVDEGLLIELLNSVYVDPDHPEFQVSVAARALTSLSLKGTPLPIRIYPEENFRMEFVEGDKYQELLDDEVISPDSTPVELIEITIRDNENQVSQIMDHPAVRSLAYDILKDHGLEGDVVLEPYVYTYEMDYLKNKASLHHSFPEITMATSAQEDFLTIVKEVALDEFLQSIRVNSNNEFIIPAEKLLNRLAELGVDSNLTYKISDDASYVTIEYEEEEETLELPLDRLKNYAVEYDLLDDLILDEDCKYLAEKAMFNAGVYPGIKISTWTYGAEQDLSDFKTRNDLTDESAEEAFAVLASDLEIQDDIAEIEKLGIMSITDRLNAQGNYAYAPVNLCYELSDTTVAKIEENIPASSGIMISTEPIRYYPYGESASHILGYIGKISNQAEIDRYIGEKNYLPNELIGKTGVEESFEDTLHGVNGKETVMIDSYGNRTETIQSTEPKPGNNLYLTIDIELQLKSEEALKKGILSTKYGLPYESAWGSMYIESDPKINSGTTISTDPNTGNLLAMASYPAFDPNLFVTGISNSDWNALSPQGDMDPQEPRPLLNLATQQAVQPGSTFKLVTATAALENGLDPDEKVESMGYLDIGNQRFACLIYTKTGQTHGPVDVREAIGVSCNYFFYTLGLGENPKSDLGPSVQVSVDDITETANELGMGDRSGLEINYPVETLNSIPSRDGKLDLAKSLLRNFLNENLIDYKKDDVFKNQSDLNADIDTIVSWADQGSSKERQAIINELEDMGYHAEKPLEDSYTGLADIIKYTYLHQANWTQSDSMSVVIGQGQNAYTPVAMNQLTNIFANGGTDYKLTLLKEIRSYDNETIVFQQEPEGSRVEASPENIEVVREGMKLSAEGPTSSYAFKDLNMSLGSKTGTAERDDVDPDTGRTYSPYAWYLAFAPYEEAKISTVTLLPNAVSSINAVSVTRDVLAYYLDVPVIDEDPNLEIYDGLSTYDYEPEEVNRDEVEETEQVEVPTE